jgi:L-alanine-DL-glutamate epimerase-like enolase superfamily enzyme
MMPNIPTIARVNVYPVTYPEPNDNNSMRFLTFVRIESTDGHVGWGEAITQFPGSTRGTVEIIKDLADDLIGKDPTQNIGIWRDIRKQTWWYSYRGGLANFALSAIDIALWDLKGKIIGQSLIQMIGKRDSTPDTRLPVLASTHVFNSSLDFEVERHARFIEDGYIGFKIGMGKRGDARIGYDVERDVQFVKDLRAAAGPKAWIMMDRGQSLNWTLDETIARVNGWEEVGLKWIEEPFEPWEFEHFRKLRQHITTLIAGGEREWDYRGYSEVISSGTLDVIGFDVGRAEGITGALAVIKLIEAAGLWFNSHAWSSGINTAASIALSASTPRCLMQELKPVENPMQHELIEEPFAAENGTIGVPSKPGLGVTVIEKVLAKYAF